MLDEKRTIKSVIDKHKPWFDVAGCMLTVVAWGIAVSTSIFVLGIAPIPFELKGILFFIVIFPAAAYTLFLSYRLHLLSIDLHPIIFDWAKSQDNEFLAWLLPLLSWWWLNIGLVLFVASLMGFLAGVEAGRRG